MNGQQQARLDGVVRGVMGPVLDDFRRGVLTREDVDKRASRLLNSIRSAYREAAPAGKSACADCRTPVLSGEGTVIGGAEYCRRCAPKHRRTPPPRFAA